MPGPPEALPTDKLAALRLRDMDDESRRPGEHSPVDIALRPAEATAAATTAAVPATVTEGSLVRPALPAAAEAALAAKAPAVRIHIEVQDGFFTGAHRARALRFPHLLSDAPIDSVWKLAPGLSGPTGTLVSLVSSHPRPRLQTIRFPCARFTCAGDISSAWLFSKENPSGVILPGPRYVGVVGGLRGVVAAGTFYAIADGDTLFFRVTAF